MKSALLMAFAALMCTRAAATDYYFSSTGDDSRTTTAATNPATPWRSISKLNAIFPTLKPGDRVLFKRGEVFPGAIKVTANGTATAPITLGAYGSGNKPLIAGYTTINNWVNKGNGLYEAVNSAFPDRIYMLTMNGQPKALGRWPNADAPLKGYMIIEGATSNSITDHQLTSSPSWTGGEVVIRTSHWTLDRGLISSHSGTTINFTEPEAVGTPKVKYGYFIQNHLRTLDQVGEWAYDKAARKVTMFFGTNNPDNYQVKVSTVGVLLDMRNEPYIVVDGLAFEGANEEAIAAVYTDRSVIRNCDISNSGMYGIEAYGTNYLTIENCEVKNTNNTGIFLKGETDHCIVRNNTVTNTGIWPGMGGNGSNTDLGMRLNGDYNLAEYNTIDYSGYCGVRFTGNYTELRNNLIRFFALTKDDAGGIYTGSQGAEFFGRKLINNIITDGIGAKEGTNTSTVQQVSGIYLDNNTAGVDIIGNTTARCGKVGIYIHNAYKIKVFDNVSFDNTAQVMVNHDDQNMTPIRYLQMKNNVFVSKLPSQIVGYFYTKANDINQFGTIDSNFYQRPLDENITIQTATYLYTASQILRKITFDTWKSSYVHDKNSRKSNRTYAATTNPDGVFRFIYNPTREPQTYALNGSYVDSRNRSYSNSIVVQPFRSVVLMYTGTAPVADVQPAPTQNQAPLVTLTGPSSATTIAAGTSYRLKANATDADGTISRVEFYRGSTLILTERSAPYENTWSNIPAGTYTITAKAYDNSGNVSTSSAVTLTATATATTSSTGAPVVSLTSPTLNASFATGATIRLKATASDADGSINRVEFFRGSTLILTERIAPYENDWTNVPAGTYVITARAYDNTGKMTTSAPVTITVGSSGTAGIAAAGNEAAMMMESDRVRAAGIRLYPNPAAANLNVQLGSSSYGKNLVINISDLSGKLVLRQQVANAGNVLNLNIGHLPAGMYVLSVMGTEVRMTDKFVKQ